ncbi:hypothetical protein BWQ96_04627 [Gracilariopsis chorda]|uniref:Aminoglycoside phosphotransferase domain-containing protein n=1 Tax=Gracilariopsis chorda TaxID=448386 RepID=A0A2V3IU36_9FLOR|nr:hypothetical protein BWQ96_04627 [Gracilariopsis chorda]|eukprot:PXF45622.1 hypothetical protein BWQ96_04627 [Gracilariopsis chorda]
MNDSAEKLESVKKLHHGSGSCVLRVRVRSDALFYMKCSNRVDWWNETWALVEVMSETFRKPLTVDMERWFRLLRDYGKTLPFGLDTENSVEHIQELVDRGVVKVDGKPLKTAVDGIVENPVWFKAHPEGMKRKQLERYSNEYRAYLERLFDNLAEYKVLLAVVHGDVEPVNVVLEGDEKCTFIDMFYTQVSFSLLNVVMLPVKYAQDLSN